MYNGMMGRQPGDTSCICHTCKPDKDRIEHLAAMKADIDRYFRGPLCRHDSETLGSWLKLSRIPTTDDLSPPDCVYLGGLLTAWYTNYSDPDYMRRHHYQPDLHHGVMDTQFDVASVLGSYLPGKIHQYYRILPPTNPYFPMGAIFSKPEYGKETFCCLFEDGRYFYCDNLPNISWRHSSKMSYHAKLAYLNNFLRANFPMPRHGHVEKTAVAVVPVTFATKADTAPSTAASEEGAPVAGATPSEGPTTARKDDASAGVSTAAATAAAAVQEMTIAGGGGGDATNISGDDLRPTMKEQTLATAAPAVDQGSGAPANKPTD